MKVPHNISLYPGTGAADGILGNHILIAPAYNMDEQQLKDLAGHVAGVTREYFKTCYTPGEKAVNGTTHGVQNGLRKEDSTQNEDGTIVLL